MVLVNPLYAEKTANLISVIHSDASFCSGGKGIVLYGDKQVTKIPADKLFVITRNIVPGSNSNSIVAIDSSGAPIPSVSFGVNMVLGAFDYNDRYDKRCIATAAFMPKAGATYYVDYFSYWVQCKTVIYTDDKSSVSGLRLVENIDADNCESDNNNTDNTFDE